ncbi:MAG TPA: hypothetical protein VMD27_06910 [Candidatus Aquilonibacter sp.]|nr:hypothetical protein [Candidatus Aquilonibacter sp.]
MKILATINLGKSQITQAWELQKGDPDPFIDVVKLEGDKNLMIRLENRFVKNAGGEAEKAYLGTLNISDAVVVPN